MMALLILIMMTAFMSAVMLVATRAIGAEIDDIGITDQRSDQYS
jgi:cell division protein FtsL